METIILEEEIKNAFAVHVKMDQNKIELTSAPVMTNINSLCINTIRAVAADTVQKANSGHPGAPMGLAPLAHVLFSKYFKCSPSNSSWVHEMTLIFRSTETDLFFLMATPVLCNTLCFIYSDTQSAWMT